MVWSRMFPKKDLAVKLPFDEIRKKAKIIVIDDDEKAFPYKLLQKEGYNVQYQPRVDRLKELEAGEYDVIVLDIFGVAKDISKKDGLGVLEHLKKWNPAQLIIAYSGQKYDLNKANFWNLADDHLGKPSDLITCKEKIDALLKANFNPQRYWNEVEKILKESGIPEKQLTRFEKKVFPILRAGKLVSSETIKSYGFVTAQSLAIINTLFQIIARFFIAAK